jgi:hypothetical protein
MGDDGVKVETIAFREDHPVFTIAELQAPMQNIKELFPAMIVENDIAGFTFLHFDDERLH